MNPRNLTHNAVCLANMFMGFGEGKADGRRKRRDRQSENGKDLGSAEHTGILVCRLHIPRPSEKKCDLGFPKQDSTASRQSVWPESNLSHRNAFTATVSSSLTSKTV